MSGMGEDSALYFGFGMATRPRAALAPGDDYCAETLTIGVLSLEGRSKIELLQCMSLVVAQTDDSGMSALVSLSGE